MAQKKKILIVDDDISFLETFALILKEEGFDVISVGKIFDIFVLRCKRHNNAGNKTDDSNARYSRQKIADRRTCSA